jgi:hypothetical protein
MLIGSTFLQVRQEVSIFAQTRQFGPWSTHIVAAIFRQAMPSPEKRSKHHIERRHGHSGDFFGLDVDSMSPRAQVAASLAVLVPVVIIGVTLIAFTPLWWLIFVFGWMIFPAFGLLVRGIAGLSESGLGIPAASDKERELLEALRVHGELSPAQAAMETSLTVAEADKMLKELAEGGHLDVRVRGGGLFYALWESGARELED